MSAAARQARNKARRGAVVSPGYREGVAHITGQVRIAAPVEQVFDTAAGLPPQRDALPVGGKLLTGKWHAFVVDAHAMPEGTAELACPLPDQVIPSHK